MEYPEKNSIEFCVGAIRFFLNDRGELWNAGKCFYEWRQPGERTWTEASGYGYLPVGKDTFEIREIGKKVYYRMDRHGYELVVEKSLEEMLKEIAERIDLIEYTNGSMFALMSDRSVNIGCIDLRTVAATNGMLTLIHSTNERTLYRLNKEKVRVLPFFEQHGDKVRELHRTLVTK